jgi:uncharacterized membrane protein YgcG
MSAAAVRYVAEMGYDDRVFTAAIVGLGVDGRLKLIDHGSTKELRHMSGNRPIDAAEQAVETELFARKSVIPLSNTEHERINGAKDKLQRALKLAYDGKLFRKNTLWSTIGLLATFAVIACVVIAYLDSYGDNAGWIIAAILIPLIPIMIGVSLVRTGRRAAGRRGGGRYYAGLIVIAVFVAIGIAILAANIGTGFAILPAVIPYGLIALSAAGFSWLKAPTRPGKQVMDKIEGFKRYLGVAEEDRLEFANPPEKTPELFERFLPYAIALNVENAWARKFAGVLAAAGVGAAVSSWYSGTHYDSDNITSFTDRIGNDLSSTIAAAATPPGSSGGSGSSSSGGSSGGGSSGGGGGGGGGSGW